MNTSANTRHTHREIQDRESAIEQTEAAIRIPYVVEAGGAKFDQ
jgi:hypothetical protein